MAFSATVLEVGILPGGRAFERGTWNGASVTTGNITARTTDVPEITNILYWAVSDDGDTAVVVARDGGATVLKLTFTTSHTGTYYMEGTAK